MLSQRYSSIVSTFHEYTYHILGCGAIGSAAATQLTRMGARDLFLYDRDKVGSENIGVSAYDTRHLGQFKADALREICMEISNDVNLSLIHISEPTRRS